MASNQLQSLSEIFNGCYFRIPDYQRGYAWAYDQLDDFWNDLINLESGHIHYTGVLTVEKISEDEKKKPFFATDFGANSKLTYYVIDGQQRLTTCIIAINSLVSRASSLGMEHLSEVDEIKDIQKKYLYKESNQGVIHYIFGYTIDNPSYEYFKSKIFGLNSTSNQYEETLYTANLQHAKDFFSNKISSFSSQEVTVLFNKITQQLKFNFYEISSDLDVFVAFETMNNRGKKLSNLELLKNRLIYLSTKIKNEDKSISLRNDINMAWKDIYRYLGENKNNVLDDDDFLKNHWIMYFKYSRKTGSDYINFLLKEEFSTTGFIENKAKDIREYVLSLQKSVRYWYFIHNSMSLVNSNYDVDESVCIAIDKLKRIGFSAFRPLLMSILSKGGYENERFLKLLSTMERFIFLVFFISQRRSNTGDSEFYNWAKSYQDCSINIDSMIGNKETGIVKWILDYYNISAFKDYLDVKFKHGKGYFSWSAIRYVLFEYEEALYKNARSNSPKISWINFNDVRDDFVTIEHILPQTATKDCWQNVVQDYEPNQIHRITHSIGNLVALSVARNSSFQNNCFIDKKSPPNGGGFSTGSYSELELVDKKNWTIDDISARGKKLLNFIEERWGIKDLNEDFSFWQTLSADDLLFIDNKKLL